MPLDGQGPAAADRAALPLLQAGGFTAHVDAYAWEPEPDPAARRMRLWLVSLLGPQQAVKALWARLVRGEVATLTDEAAGVRRFCALAPEGPGGWRFHTAGLPGAAGFHGALVPEVAYYGADRRDFVLLARPEDEPAALHYRFLNRRLDLPLHPSWASWLWERSRRVGETTALESHGIRAYRCSPDPDALAADVSAAVRAGALTVEAG